MSKKRILRYLSYIGIAGGVLLMAAFFLKIAVITVNDVGYQATGYDLTQARIRPDYLIGIGPGVYSVPLSTAYPIFYMMFIIGMASLPFSTWRDTYLRGAGALCGALGIVTVVTGYVQFSDRVSPSWTVDIGYGFVLAILAGSLMLVSNLLAIHVMVRRPKKKKPKKVEREEKPERKAPQETPTPEETQEKTPEEKPDKKPKEKPEPKQPKESPPPEEIPKKTPEENPEESAEGTSPEEKLKMTPE